MIYCNTEVKEGRVRDDGVAGPHDERKGKAEKREKSKGGIVVAESASGGRGVTVWAMVWLVSEEEQSKVVVTCCEVWPMRWCHVRWFW